MRPAASWWGRSRTAPAATASSAPGCRSTRMQRNARLVLLLLASLSLAACATSEKRTENKSDKETKKSNAADVNVSLAQNYLSQGKYEIALEKLQKALAFDPKSTSAHTVMAVLYERIGNDAL